MVMTATSASAEGRLWLTGGGAFRDHQQLERDVVVLRVGGSPQSIAPWNVHLSGAYFFNSFLGVDLEGRGELFYATQSGTRPVPQPGFELTPAATARWVPLRWLSLEGQLGWAFQLRSGIQGGPSERDIFFTGPSFGAAVGLAPTPSFGAQLFFRAQPVNVVLGAPGAQAGFFSGGAQLKVGALRLGIVELGVAISLEVSSGRLVASESGAAQLGVRGGLGLALSRVVEERDVVLEPVQAAKVSLTGLAISADGASLAGVVVTLDGESPLRTDEKGAFTFPDVTTGPHVLRARKDGYQAASLEVNVTATPAPVTLTLLAPTGPGRIRGVVRSAEGTISGATLSVGEQQAVSDDQGRFVLDAVGPGPVKVQVKAADFQDAEEVAQVPPEAEAALDFTLVPKAAEVRATLRGLIRAKSGEAVKATVRVVELKLKLPVKPDGRFSAEVPSGKYTLIIEARGYLTQTKTVEVSGGDQAIFHAELEKTR